MKKKILAAVCIAAIFLFYIGIRTDFHSGNPKKALFEEGSGSGSRSGLSGQVAAELPKQVRPKPPEEITLMPERVVFPKPQVTLDGGEGKWNYRWGYDCVLVDENTVLLSCDCFFAEQGLNQKIFYLAEAPDYVPREVFRQDSLGGFEDRIDFISQFPSAVERRFHRPRAVQALSGVEQDSAETAPGYVYELNGGLYCLSADFRETALICDLRELMGGLYEFSPWTAEDSTCDVSMDASRMLACTDEGLYEYDLRQGGKTLLEPAVFQPYEIVHIEGDCDCGETGFEFSGPIAAEYAPDGQSYAFLAGNEYGEAESITLRSGEGETLYQRILEYNGYGLTWLESEATVCFAAFYREKEGTWMDRVDVHTGETETFAVPDGALGAVSFLDGDSLIYYGKYVSAYWEEKGQGRSVYEIYRLRSGEIQDLKTASMEGVIWRLVLLKGGDHVTAVRYPQMPARADAMAGNEKNRRKPPLA